MFDENRFGIYLNGGCSLHTITEHDTFNSGISNLHWGLQIDLVWYQNVIIDRFCLNKFFYFIEGYSFEYIDIHGYIIIK